MQITFWGTRGSIAAPGPHTLRYGGNTSCVEVRLDDGTLVIFDAGTGIRPLGNALQAQGQPVRAYLFLSHVHWDHIQGLPFFAPAYAAGTELWILGPEGDGQSLEQIICDQMRSPYYPVPMGALAATIRFVPLRHGSTFALPEATVTAARINHPGHTLAYRLSAGNKSLVYATDNEPFGPQAASHHLPQPAPLTELARAADVLIQDAMYTPEEYPQHVGWGHSTYLDALHLARDASVQHLFLYHHDPEHSDAQIDTIVAHCRAWLAQQGAAFTCQAAAEGLQLRL
ncbi:MAG: MBL fold metallo-hydrolase [Candidatus Tectimicrobiota bacterium]|nr:MAG: MBL fold metallo-hydrolase [Candidatus Tectomicrobia bacterium]